MKSKRREELSSLKKDVLNKLESIGERLGFISEKEHRTEMGIIDFDWFVDKSYFKRIPIIGFEIETSWRTRKHLKGDIMNLLSLSPAIGIILLLKSGFSNIGDFEKEADFKGNLKAVEKYAKSFGGVSKILVWTEDEVNKLYNEITK